MSSFFLSVHHCGISDYFQPSICPKFTPEEAIQLIEVAQNHQLQCHAAQTSAHTLVQEAQAQFCIADRNLFEADFQLDCLLLALECLGYQIPRQQATCQQSLIYISKGL